jgi:hypothetical protein
MWRRWITLYRECESDWSYPRGMRWRSWFKNCATSRKDAGSIPNRVTEIFLWLNPSGRTMAVVSAQPPTEMSTRNDSWGVEAASAQGWQRYRIHMPIVWEPQTFRGLEACPGLYIGTALLVASWRKVHNRHLTKRSEEKLSSCSVATEICGTMYNTLTSSFIQISKPYVT